MKMHIKILVNDFRKKIWKNGILFLFMCLSVTIAASVVLMISQLFTSITTMYETAKPPHFLQMHRGPIEQGDIDRFNENFQGVTYWQTFPMITLYGEDILHVDDGSTESFSECRLDISFVKQNNEYDVLLDEKQMPIRLNHGEVGVPVIVLEQYDISIGDEIVIRCNGVERTFEVVMFVHDGMMNSTMCSSTRFLISDDDFDSLLGKIGETEYMIETYFTDESLAAVYQTAYEQSDMNLPKNGQAITYTIIFLLSAMTDILTAMVFGLAGILLIFVVVMCLRYVALAELEDDVMQIGTMKAIGIPEKGIENIYLIKIRIMMALAGVTGFLLSLILLPGLTGHISRFFGTQPLIWYSLVGAFLAIVIIYLIIIFCVKRILKKIRKKTIVDLLVLDDGFGKKYKVNSKLNQSKKLSTNILIGLQESKNGYGVVFTFMFVITLLIMIPMRSLQTMQEDEFVTYMGSPVCDLLVEVIQGEDLEKRNEMLYDLLEQELEKGNIQQFEPLRRVRLQAFSDTGEVVGVHVDTGMSAGKGIVYLSGDSPTVENQIALSYLLADELGKQVGDLIEIVANQQTQSMIVCGIYQDVTSGGRTAKSICDFTSEASEKYSYQMKLSKENSNDSYAQTLQQELGSGYSIKSMDAFLEQVIGGVTKLFSKAVYGVIAIGIIITVFIIMLFMELRLARTMHALAEKIVMGIPMKAIYLQELYPMLIHGSSGIVVGIIFTELMGEKLVSALFSLFGLGITRITFSHMTMSCVLVPVSLIIILGVINLSICLKIKKIDITEYFNQ